MQFLADAMLGRLARWLRILGYDTLSASDMPVDDNDLINISLTDGRVLLTKDRELFERASSLGARAVLVPDGSLEEQLAALVKEGMIEVNGVPSRSVCPTCNGTLTRVSRAEVKGTVPQTVFDTHDEFWLCSECGQVYWEGNHWKKMREVIEKVKELTEG